MNRALARTLRIAIGIGCALPLLALAARADEGEPRVLWSFDAGG